MAEEITEGGFLLASGKAFLATLLVLAGLFVLLKIVTVWQTRRKRRRWGFQSRAMVVGFFHPYCNAGGGGERVLWQSVCALQRRYSFVRCVVFTGAETDSSPNDILDKAQQRFGISLDTEQVKFVYLKSRPCVEAGKWPRFTLLGQSVGSMVLGFEALLAFVPDVYIDSMGYAFTMPLFRWLGGSKTVSYVHYPVVSRDMLQQVKDGVGAFNNAKWISRSRILTKAKLIYYRLFAKLYGFVGRRSNVVMLNSSWTHSHISEIWGSRNLHLVYPPCDTAAFTALPMERDRSQFRIVTIGQFRPEKNHRLQLRVLKALLDSVNDYEKNSICLVLIGSCRNDEDQMRVNELKQYAEQLGVSKNVEFKISIPFEGLRQELCMSTAALHTMLNEHFGISLVESMAAGCVMVAHNSGGPRMDILADWQGQRVGYLAGSEEEFLSQLLEVFYLPELNRRVLVKAARDSVRTKFSVEVFEASFLRATEHLFV